MKVNNLTFIGCDTPYEDAKIVIVGAPFDGTVSYRPGTRFAPNAIRLDSEGLETYSPYQDKELTKQNILDAGDIDMVFGSKDRSLDAIYETVKTLVTDNKKPCLIGGEHLVSFPIIKAVHEKYPDLQVIQFDAHADLREDYLGEPFSHATVMRRVVDLIGDGKLYQYGIRSGLKSEFDYADKHHTIERFSANTAGTLKETLKGKPVYITIDLDVLDPSIMSGTGTPEPGGLTFKELHNALLSLRGLNIVGCDVVELSPDYDPSGVSTATASKVIRELLLML